ncbi:hypothetical protein NL676_032938 [Syzygium grande]|nr:hypothetical protein NL676_032938 [Syzygium grande]
MSLRNALLRKKFAFRSPTATDTKDVASLCTGTWGIHKVTCPQSTLVAVNSPTPFASAACCAVAVALEMGQGEEVKTRKDPKSKFSPVRGQSGRSKIPTPARKATTQATVQGGHGSQEVNIEKQALLRLMRSTTLPRGDTATRLRPERWGEGVYRILRHKSRGKKAHTLLIYKLEFPPEDEKQEPRESLNVDREGSFLIQIKNPDQHGAGPSQFRGLQSKRKAVFPAHLQGQFGQLRYNPADPPDFLNYEGCELLLTSASDDIEEELGLELIPEGEADPSCADLLKTCGETAPVDALLREHLGLNLILLDNFGPCLIGRPVFHVSTAVGHV